MSTILSGTDGHTDTSISMSLPGCCGGTKMDGGRLRHRNIKATFVTYNEIRIARKLTSSSTYTERKSTYACMQKSMEYIYRK